MIARWLALALALATPAMAAPATAQPPAAVSKLVFAHFMVCCSKLYEGYPSVDQLAEEIALARGYGIDGFALNIGQWSKNPYYRRIADGMFLAARRFPGFKMFLSADRLPPDDVVDVLRRYGRDPAYLRVNGRLFVSTFGSNPGWDAQLRQTLRPTGLTIYFVPHEYPPPPGNREQPSATVFNAQYSAAPKPDGYFYFGAAGSGPALAASDRAGAAAAHANGLTFMASVSPNYRGYGGNNRTFATGGFGSMAAQWRAAIEGGADFVEIVTWNDWGESTYVRPFGENRVQPAAHWPAMLPHDGFLDASRPYIQQFHTGRMPPVTADRVHVFYRVHAGADCDSRLLPGAKYPCPLHYDTLVDQLDLVIEARRPTRIVVQSGLRRTMLDLPAGRSSRDVPLGDGPLSVTALSAGSRRTWTSPVGFGHANRGYQHAMLAWSF